MKFSKFLIISSIIFSCCSAMANESIGRPNYPEVQTEKYEEMKDEPSFTPYIGYELGNWRNNHPILGYRYQNGNYIYDVNLGYKYIRTTDNPIHFYKSGINIFRTLYKIPTCQLYAGVGVDFSMIKRKSYYGKKNDHSVDPSITIGHDFNIAHNKKIFFDISYKPYSFGKYENSQIHHTSFRYGFGF